MFRNVMYARDAVVGTFVVHEKYLLHIHLYYVRNTVASYVLWYIMINCTMITHNGVKLQYSAWSHCFMQFRDMTASISHHHVNN